MLVVGYKTDTRQKKTGADSTEERNEMESTQKSGDGVSETMKD